MAKAKTKVGRTSKLSIEVVKNGYSVKTGGEGDGYFSTISFYCNGEKVSTTTPPTGDYVFNDFSQLSSFLRKHLSVPVGL